MSERSLRDGPEEKRHGADYEGLPVWQRANELAYQVYAATKSFPAEEIEGITAQLRRAALQVPVSIAEMHHGQSDVPTQLRFDTATRLLMRLRYLLDFASRLDYLKAPADKMLRELAEEVAAALETTEVSSRLCESESEKHLRTLGKMLMLYLNDHDDRYPDSLVQYEQECGQHGYGLDFKWVHQHIGYLGKGKSCKSMPPDMPIAYDKTMLAGRRETYVLFNAAYVRRISGAECMELGLMDS